VTLVVIYCNDLTVIMLKMYKAAAVLSALVKVYTISCQDRGHNNPYPASVENMVSS